MFSRTFQMLATAGNSHLSSADTSRHPLEKHFSKSEDDIKATLKCRFITIEFIHWLTIGFIAMKNIIGHKYNQKPLCCKTNSFTYKSSISALLLLDRSLCWHPCTIFNSKVYICRGTDLF